MINRGYAKMIQRAVHEVAPAIYASFCLALHRRYNFGYRRIVTILADTQQYWLQHQTGETNIIKLCEEETGINVLSEQTAKETGAKGEEI